MLKGFIDLVFVADGKYYIVDYKSNHLGDQLSDYSEQQLSEVMIDHRYDFQYQLYSLALHRLLATRLPDYDFERHFGGVYYLFLRGIDCDGSETANTKTDSTETASPATKNNQGSGIFYNRPSKAFITELDCLFTHGSSLFAQGAVQ